MPDARVLRFGVAAWAIAAVLGLSVLPAAHLHTSESGRTIVHRHFDDHEADHHGLLDHDDHHAASTVAATFVVSRTQQFQPALTVVTFSLVAPEPGTRAHAAVLDEPAIHGPPRRSASPRAPPA